nr:hypothetical protein [Rickettsia tillamookensis]
MDPVVKPRGDTLYLTLPQNVDF